MLGSAETVDDAEAKLKALGWSCWEMLCRTAEGKAYWLVLANRGEHRMVGKAAMRGDAWTAGAEQARTLDAMGSTTDESRPLGDMRIDLADACEVLNMLLEGRSICACSRLTGMKADTLCDLVLLVGGNCERLLQGAVTNVAAKAIELDEPLRNVTGPSLRCRMGAMNSDPTPPDKRPAFSSDRDTRWEPDDQPSTIERGCAAYIAVKFGCLLLIGLFLLLVFGPGSCISFKPARQPFQPRQDMKTSDS